jgi:hypothetical protein
MVYRLRQGTTDFIGYTEAQSHPDFTGSDLQTGGYPATAPLFVKVGYPFDLAWNAGSGYTYNIALNADNSTTGGYLLDAFYYDQYGNRTDLPITGGTEVPGPVLGDGDIHLIPDISDWDEETDPVR